MARLEVWPARDLLRTAASLCKRTGDRGLGARVEALRSLLAIEWYGRLHERALARLHRTWRRTRELGDWQAFIDVGETISRLHAWRHEYAEALQTLEKLCDQVSGAKAWAPPRLGHLQRLYRALALPSPATVAPLIAELKDLLRRGGSTWRDSLDHLDQLRVTVGEEKFVALVGAFLGPEMPCAWRRSRGVAFARKQSED